MKVIYLNTICTVLCENLNQALILIPGNKQPKWVDKNILIYKTKIQGGF